MANRTDLIAKVAEVLEEATGPKVSIKGQGVNATLVVDSVLDAVEELLVADGKVAITGFGSFEVRERAARKGRNPQTGEEIEIAATKSPAFKPAKGLKDAVKA